MVVTSDGELYSWGWSEFGQLGHGTDGSFNQSASSVKITYEAERTPRRVGGFGAHGKVVAVACGPHHVAALTADGTAFTWGAGGYGRLGHKDQADVWAPKALPNFLFKSVSCGNCWTCGVGWQVYNPAAARPSGGGILHIWGRFIPNRDASMYPKPEYDLQGWDVTRIASGNVHNVCATGEGSTISWGSGAAFGELGYGAGGPKSSAKPKKVDDLEGATVANVAAGLAHTVRREGPKRGGGGCCCWLGRGAALEPRLKAAWSERLLAHPPQASLCLSQGLLVWCCGTGVAGRGRSGCQAARVHPGPRRPQARR